MRFEMLRFDWSIFMQIIESIPKSWRQLVESKWTDAEISVWEDKIASILEEGNHTPDKKNLFKAFEMTNFKGVKVVILGQDPYPTPGHANGLAFSTEDFVQPFPKSLLNIFKELKRSIPEYDLPLTGNLTGWAKQGVLLINTCLSTEKGTANAHQKKGWEELTSLFLSELFKKKKNIVGMFWGNQAKRFIENITMEDHLILTSSHPSPLSFYRGFSGCNHFSLCNDYMVKNHKKTIDWQT